MSFVSQWRRRRIVSSKLIDPELWRRSCADRRIFAGLDRDELLELRKLATVFMHEKAFSAARGFIMTDEAKATIAAMAALPVLKLGIDWYRNWKTVVVVPSEVVYEHSEADESLVVHEWAESSAGESWDDGPVVLSWQDVEDSGRGDGFNVVIHEAAHRIDLTDGAVNGRPRLHSGIDEKRWFKVCSDAFSALSKKPRRSRSSRIDRYATSDDGEFFAVLTEYFFERPGVVRRELPELYTLFEEFFRQDPWSRSKPG